MPLFFRGRTQRLLPDEWPAQTSAPATKLHSQQLLTAGMLRPEHLLDIVRNFTVFQQVDGRTRKVVTRYQQFRAVHKTTQKLLSGRTAKQNDGRDERGGIVWHTQGSGKSLTMAFLVRKMRSVERLRKFNVVVVTDRTDLERQLGETAGLTGETVRPSVDRKAAEEVAQRIPCADFATFRPVFERVQKDLDVGKRSTSRFQHNGKLEPGDLFILEGQKVLVAAAGEVMMKEFGREDRRLGVIYDNGTESNLLLRSLQRALYKDEHGRRILPADAEAAPLFADQVEEEDTQVGYIYVLRSLSDHPFAVAKASL